MKKMVWLMALLFLAGCSGAPGEGSIKRKVAQQLYDNDGDHIYRLENFEKLNGSYRGDNIYLADIQYDLVFKQSYEEAAEEVRQHSKDSPLGALGPGMDLFVLKLQYGDFKAGDVIHKEKRVTLVKTDQGWMLESR